MPSQKIPDLDQIAAGHCLEVPEAIDLQYAVAAALVSLAVRCHRESTNILTNVLRYAAQFPQREMGVMLVADLHRALGKDLFAAEGFADWAESMADLVLYE